MKKVYIINLQLPGGMVTCIGGEAYLLWTQKESL